MKLLKTLVIALLLLMLMVVVAGMFMDSQWQVERRGRVTAPVAKVYEYISTIRQWSEWTAWNKEAYPQMQLTYSGPDTGVGARQTWHDGAMGGFVEITAVVPGQSLDYVVNMDSGTHAMQCRLAVEPAGEAATVIWRCSGDSGGNPLDRLMMAAYKPMIGRDFEIGLARLQQQFQAQKE